MRKEGTVEYAIGEHPLVVETIGIMDSYRDRDVKGWTGRNVQWKRSLIETVCARRLERLGGITRTLRYEWRRNELLRMWELVATAEAFVTDALPRALVYLGGVGFIEGSEELGAYLDECTQRGAQQAAPQGRDNEADWPAPGETVPKSTEPMDSKGLE